jgi:hypothetical protein
VTPIVVAFPYNANPNAHYWVDSVTTDSFVIHRDGPATQSALTFNWIVVGVRNGLQAFRPPRMERD